MKIIGKLKETDLYQPVKTIYKAYKFRLYPNKEQEILIQKTFGCCRFVYNYFLAKRKKLYKKENNNLTFNQMSKKLTKIKQKNEWLKEVDSTALQNSLKNLNSAYENFFNKRGKYPKFKAKKDSYKSYKTTNNKKRDNNTIDIENNKIKLIKLRWVKIKKTRKIKGRILHAIISQVPSGKYFISICCEVEINQLPQVKNNIGIDLGIKDFAIFSNGEKIVNPKYYRKLEKKLKKEHKKLSRKQKGSNNRNKQRIRLARIYEKIHNQKLDFLHKLSTKLINENQVICLEDLHIQDMLQNNNKSMNKNINNVSWYEFKRQLLYKAEWYGKQIILINRYFPSSKLCSNCGYRMENMNLSIREWRCPNCEENHDRDINAAKNILNEGLKQIN